MSVGFVLTIMVFITEEKVFIIEHYFRSYGVGHQNGPSLRHVWEHYEEQFKKTASSNKTILAIIEKFHATGSVLCQRREQLGAWGLWPQMRIMNDFSNKCYCSQSIYYDEHRWNLVWATGLFGRYFRIHIPYSSCSASNWNGESGPNYSIAAECCPWFMNNVWDVRVHILNTCYTDAFRYVLY